VGLLLKHGAYVLEFFQRKVLIHSKVGAKDDEDETPLHCAAKNGHFGVVQDLLSNRASIYEVNMSKQAPFDIARSEQVRKLLGMNSGKLLLLNNYSTSKSSKTNYCRGACIRSVCE
jgi:ankyrin repeat protein